MPDRKKNKKKKKKPKPKPKITRRAVGFLAVIGTALLVAIATAFGTGLGSDLWGEVKPDEVLISSSATEQFLNCGTSLFVEEAEVERLVSGAVPTEQGWEPFYENHDAVLASSVVDVSIQGESSRPINLNGIEFSVQRQRRPPGGIFANDCGGVGTGRFVVVDLDRRPPRIVGSAVDPDAYIGVLEDDGRRLYEPISFPWSVSITDVPLSLTIIAKTKRCYCTWKAVIPWSSGSKTGEIAIDNDGKGYAVVGSYGLYSYGRRPGGGWHRGEIIPILPPTSE